MTRDYTPRAAWVRGSRGTRESQERPERGELGGRETGSGRGPREKGDRERSEFGVTVSGLGPSEGVEERRGEGRLRTLLRKAAVRGWRGPGESGAAGFRRVGPVETLNSWGGTGAPCPHCWSGMGYPRLDWELLGLSIRGRPGIL